MPEADCGKTKFVAWWRLAVARVLGQIVNQSITHAPGHEDNDRRHHARPNGVDAAT
jgi:hypothetical protein